MAKGSSRANGFKGTAMPNVITRRGKGQAPIGPIKARAAGGATGAGFTAKTTTSSTKSTGKAGGTKKIG